MRLLFLLLVALPSCSASSAPECIDAGGDGTCASPEAPLPQEGAGEDDAELMKLSLLQRRHDAHAGGASIAPGCIDAGGDGSCDFPEQLPDEGAPNDAEQMKMSLLQRKLEAQARDSLENLARSSQDVAREQEEDRKEVAPDEEKNEDEEEKEEEEGEDWAEKALQEDRELEESGPVNEGDEEGAEEALSLQSVAREEEGGKKDALPEDDTDDDDGDDDDDWAERALQKDREVEESGGGNKGAEEVDSERNETKQSDEEASAALAQTAGGRRRRRRTPPVSSGGGPEEGGYMLTQLFRAGQGGYHTFRIPALINAGGRLLAFCEGRVNGHQDTGNIDIVMKSSDDSGFTWSKLQLVLGDTKTVGKSMSGDTWGNPSAVYEEPWSGHGSGRVHLLLSYNKGNFHQFDKERPVQPGDRRTFYVRSDDKGKTWTKVKDITDSSLPPGVAWDAMGPGAGIQKKKEPRKGMLVVPALFRNLISEDHGDTWTYVMISKESSRRRRGVQGSESTVVELKDGAVLRNDRPAPGCPTANRRCVLKIPDPKVPNPDQNWMTDNSLPDPRCQGSTLRYDDDHIVFLNSASKDSRFRMKVRVSLDDGQTWKDSRDLYEPRVLAEKNRGGYSSIATTRDGHVAALVEEQDRGVRDGRSIDFARLTLQWVKAPMLIVKDDYPGGFEKKGQYFGFDTKDGDRFFGGSDWNKKKFRIRSVTHGVTRKVMVFRDNPKCKMSCGRWASDNDEGDWSVNDEIRQVVRRRR